MFPKPLLSAAFLFAALLAAGPASAADNELSDAEKAQGYTLLFNGTDLTGWHVLPQFWSVVDGAITGTSTRENPVKASNYAICTAGDFGDFELHALFKIAAVEPGGFCNSGIQFRSHVTNEARCVVDGYQADMDDQNVHTGTLYEQGMRGGLANLGQKVVLHDGPSKKKAAVEVVGSLGSHDSIKAAIRPGEWNEYVIIAKGHQLQAFINGVQTYDVDDESSQFAPSGIIALQPHTHSLMVVSYKDIKIRPL